MKKKNMILCAAAVAASMLFAAPAMAKQYTNADGNITIDLPSYEWNEVIDPSAEFVFTNGVDVISAKKYNPDEKVEVARNDDNYNAVLQLSYAYSDQLIVLTAKVADAPHLADIYKAITSIQFSGISAENEEKKDVNNYVVNPEDMVLYVKASEGLNLRQNFSVESDILTTIPYAAEVHVTGTVQLNGELIGWDKVEYQGKTGYVASANLTSRKPELQSNPTFHEIVDDISYYVYMYHADGTPEKIVVLNNGTRLDMNGNRVVGFADAACQMYDGTIIYDFDPTTMSIDDYIQGNDEANTWQPETTAAGGRVLYNDNGDTSIIFQESDGSWYDIYGNAFWENEAGIWFNLTDNSEWY